MITARDPLRCWFLLCMGLAAGGGAMAGWWLKGLTSTDQSAPPEIVRSALEPSRMVEAPIRTQTEPSPETHMPRVRDDSPARYTPQPAGGTGAGEFLAELESLGMRVIPIDLVARIDIPVITTGSPPELTGEMISLFGMGEQEVTRINWALADAADRLNLAELDRLEMVNVTDTAATFKIPAVGDLGDQVEQEMRATILATLGSTDGPIFLEMLDKTSGQYWNAFGRNEVELTYSAVPDNNGNIGLRIERTTRGPDGSSRGSSTRSTSRPIQSAHSYPAYPFGRDGQRHDYLLDLLPDPIRSHFVPAVNP